MSGAQRRPGTRPRRHMNVGRDCVSVSSDSLNEGRGLGPGDTRPRRPRRLRRRTLNEGRGLGPGDTRCGPRSPVQARPLNEGRGLGPGDTRGPPPLRSAPYFAQRRPGTRPRRHGQRRACDRHRRRRSTKAGDSAPATQRSPRFTASPVSSLNEGRGLGPGDTRWSAGGWRWCGSLNEGRGLGPGDTLEPRRLLCQPEVAAQRRPGTRPRRHLNTAAASMESSPAQRRPGTRPRRHVSVVGRTAEVPTARSTKAGDSAPATHPGGTGKSPSQQHAQRRPGTRPRRHPDTAVCA